ncbi:MAG: hypothetical protein MK212_14145 [Saprospiraceae bacterium]|nr:hypothetical protein [Saprospiraceae bacterium]
MLYDEIILGKGLKEIQIGDPLLKLRDHLLKDPQKWKVELTAAIKKGVPDFIDYTFENAIRFRVNPYLGKISAIKFFGDFCGTILQEYGIGSIVTDLKKREELELSFDEHYVLVNKDDLIITVDNNQEFIDDWQDIKYNTIETITIEHFTFNRMSFKSSELEKIWQA